MAEDRGERIIPVSIEDEMKTAYIDYSMSVIVSRALPDVRDGLKPVHRRVLYGMQELGVRSTSSYKKSARIVGEVLGKYHPHGDSSVYDTMVRMAQEWSLRYPLVDGQGNFGSVDGDSPAAMRYTEAKLKKAAEELLSDLDKETVDFSPNFDDSLSEPTVLPTRIPNLLVNGAAGIAVGMATNMAPHNLSEVIDGTIAYIDNREIDIEGLMQFIKAPDFPTGGIIYGYEGVKNAFETGRGRIVMRAKATIEEIREGREAIIVTEIPYQVNKADMIEKTASLVHEGKIEGISELRDESDRKGMRIVYEIKRDAIPNVVLNKLYKYTALQTSFSVNNIALVKGRPQMLNLKDMISEFVDHRHEVVVRRTKYELRKAEERAHILEGLIIASDNIDEVIALIRSSKSPDEAREKLIDKFKLSDIQSRAIVEMRLRQLTGLEQDKLRAEYDSLMNLIKELKEILDDEGRRMEIIKTELIEVKDKYGDERRSIIEYSANEMRIEDLIPNEEVVVTISHAGYIKRTNLSEYKVQNRGGVGSKGSTTRDKDFLEELFVATNHNWLLVFTEKGKCFWMRIFEIPEGSKISKGRAIQNLLNIEQDDKVKAYVVVKDIKNEEYLKRPATQVDVDNGFADKLDELVIVTI
jgi:DNA gyrase subunit A